MMFNRPHQLQSALFNATWGTWGLAFLMLGALIVPFLGQDATFIHVDNPLLAPFSSGVFPLGTDDLGRDLLARLAVGATISLLVGGVVGGLSALTGLSIGLLGGLNEGKWVDTALNRFIDLVYSLPSLVIVVLIAVFLEPFILKLLPATLAMTDWIRPVVKVAGLVLALAFFSWPDTAKIIRAETLRLVREPFVEAYHSLGGNTWRLIVRHLLPNLAPYLLLSLTLSVPRAILTESTLSFIGLGIEAPLSSWGTLAAEGWYLLKTAPHILVLATIGILFSMLCFHQITQQIERQFSRK
jgi:ABC-type dipeptide/oligopeptide/nickel transport system permease subunit